MTAQRGALVLLKVESADKPGSYITIGGMKTTRMVLNNQLIDCTNKTSGPWRELLPASGISSVAISGSGIFIDSQAEENTRSFAFANLIKNYELCFGNGDKIYAAFQIVSYERSGSYNDEETYAITLESSGEVKFVKANV